MALDSDRPIMFLEKERVSLLAVVGRWSQLVNGVWNGGGRYDLAIRVRVDYANELRRRRSPNRKAPALDWFVAHERPIRAPNGQVFRKNQNNFSRCGIERGDMFSTDIFA